MHHATRAPGSPPRRAVYAIGAFGIAAVLGGSTCEVPGVVDPGGPSVPVSPPLSAPSDAPDPEPSGGSGEPTTTPAGDEECDVVAFEAESLSLTGAWEIREDSAASGGSYITWEGLSPEKNNQEPADVIEAEVSITTAGTYRFVWAMRQPDGVERDKANDSWLNVPDATRFGPADGGSYGGFVKVFGNSTGSFAYKAKADDDHAKSDIAVEFDAPGTYTVQIGGRSHGHQIDRVVLHHESVSEQAAISGDDCGAAPSGPEPSAPAPSEPAPTEPGTGSPVPDDAPFDPASDLISLHYDHAPDRDDGHATVAGRELTADLGIDPHVVGGAYGKNGGKYQSDSEDVMAATWGSDWVNAHRDWPGAVAETADRWQATLDGGGDVWVAEGGQSDLTADVVRELVARDAGLDSGSRIHVVQHSDWNEENTTGADLAYVKQATDYRKIDDGNSTNATADLNQKSSQFVQAARAGAHGSAWDAAFDYLDPTERLDFSDTVELLHIVGIDKSAVADPDDFADRFIS